MTQSAKIARQTFEVVPQTLKWDELTPRQRLAIVRASVPSFSLRTALALSDKPWGKIGRRMQLALSTLSWDRVIQGVRQ